VLKSRINYFLEVDGMFKRAAACIYDVQNIPYEAILQLQAI
jgi:COP9 signalosome complex subunit 4